MTLHLMFLLSIAILISYIVISLSKETKFRIKKTIKNIDPLEYKYTIERRHKIFKIWIGPLYVKNNGQITYSFEQYSWFCALKEAQRTLDDYSKWLNHKDKYYQVEYSINTKETD